jgi:outer membrane protein
MLGWVPAGACASTRVHRADRICTPRRTRSRSAAGLAAAWIMSCGAPGAWGAEPETPAAKDPAAAAESVKPTVAKGAQTSPASRGPVAVVNLQRAIRTSVAGKQVDKRVEELSEARQKVLFQQEAKVRESEDAFEKEKAKLGSFAAERRELELGRLRAALDRAIEEAREDIALSEREFLDPVLKRVRELLPQIAQEKGYALILEDTELEFVYLADGTDITELVVERLDRAE